VDKFSVTKQELKLFRKTSMKKLMRKYSESKTNTLYMDRVGVLGVSRFFVTNGHIALVYLKSESDNITDDTIDQAVSKKVFDNPMIKISGSDMDRVLGLSRVRSDILFDSTSMSIDGFGVSIDTEVVDKDEVVMVFDAFPERNPGGKFPSPKWVNIEDSENDGIDIEPGKQVDHRACSILLHTRYLAIHSLIADALGIRPMSDSSDVASMTPTQITLPLKYNGAARFDTIGKGNRSSATLIIMPVMRW